MTQIGGYVPASTRAGLLGVHSMDHVSIEVPDLEAARRFYHGFGLRVVESGGGLDIFTQVHAHRWLRFVEGPGKRLMHVSFGAYARDMPRFAAHLAALGIERLAPPPGMADDGIWLRDPDGTLLEIKVAEKSSPGEKTRAEFISAPANLRAMPTRDQMPVAVPRRLSHILLFASDIPRAIDFYCRVLGLRLSDEAGVVAFLHGVHGSDHHLVAFAQSGGPGLHHVSWDVASVQDIGVGAARMADLGFSRGWGFGRHVLGSNYFHYVRDPWGSYSEYSCDIDFISADHDWQAMSHTPENGFYLWGPVPPEDFAHNYEIG